MKKARTYILRFLMGVIATVLILFVAVQTTWVRSWVKEKIESAVSDATGGTLTIDDLGGTFLGNVILEGITLRFEGDTLASLASLDVEFSLLGLLSQSALIDELGIENLRVRIDRRADGSWNVDRLGTSDDEQEDPGGPGGDFPWVIRADLIRVSGCTVTIDSRDSSGGGALAIHDLSLNASVMYSEQHKELRIDSLSFVMRNPDIELRSFAARAKVQDGALVVSQAEMATGANVLSLSGQLGLQDGIPSKLTVESGPLELSEVPGLPRDLSRKIHPALTGTVELLDDDLTAHVDLVRESERLRCAGTIGRLSTDFRTSLTLELERFNMGDWFPERVPPSSLTGVLRIEGSGIDPDRIDVELTASLTHSRAFDRSLDSLHARAHVRASTVQGEVEALGPFGSARFRVAVRDIRSMSGYDVDLRAERLDLSVLTDNVDLTSNLGIEGHLSGSGTNLSEAAAVLNIRAYGAIGEGLTFDSLEASAEIANGTVLVHDLHIVNSALTADVSGAYGQNETLSATGTVRLIDAAPILALADLDTPVEARGELEIDVSGLLDSLDSRIVYALSDMHYGPLSADSLSGAMSASLVHGELGGSGQVKGLNLLAGGVGAESVIAVAEYREGMLRANSSVGVTEDLAVSIGGRVWPGNTTRLEISSLAVAAGDDTWVKEADPVLITIAGSRVELDGFAMHSGRQSLTLQGVFDSNDSVDVRATVDSMEIGPVSTYAGLPVSATGTVTMELHVRGKAAQPLIDADLAAEEVTLGGQLVGDVTLAAAARDSGIGWDLGLTDRFGNEVGSNGRVPYVISINGLAVTQDSSLFAHLETQGYDLKWIRSMRDEFGEVAGILSAQLDLAGALSRPAITGTIQLREGVLTIPSFGLDVRQLVVTASADGSRLRLDSLGARVGGGTLTAFGTATLPLVNSTSRADSAALMVTANQVSINARRRYEAQLNSTLRASFANDKLEYSGNITVPQARIYLQGIFATISPARRSTDRPLLVQATVPFDSAGASRADSASRKRRGAPVIGKSTRGRVDLSFPKNTWIQSPNINVEFYGDLTAIQTDTLLELEGTLTISRGTVQIVGKRFLVRRGNAQFSRGPSIDPIFTIELEYRFRDANRQDRYLTARLTGTVETPNMNFALDEKPVTQQDAISYLIFGRSVDELTMNQQSSVSGGKDNVAGAMAFDMLGAQLSNMIAQRVGLDVVEIKSTDGTKAGTLTAGKYIAEGVFISYEKGFGEYGTNESIPEVFTIEYELIRSLFLQFVQANDRRSGADVILKIE